MENTVFVSMERMKQTNGFCFKPSVCLPLSDDVLLCLINIHIINMNWPSLWDFDTMHINSHGLDEPAYP